MFEGAFAIPKGDLFEPAIDVLMISNDPEMIKGVYRCLVQARDFSEGTEREFYSSLLKKYFSEEQENNSHL